MTKSIYLNIWTASDSVSQNNNASAFHFQSKTRARIYPTYHTAYDTFDYVAKFIDPGVC